MALFASLPLRRPTWTSMGLAAAFTVLGGAAAAMLEAPGPSVSQKGREFRPGSLSIRLNDVVQIVNDDGDLLHHAYVEAENFSFDSGDQEPGSKTDIKFTVAGDFKVLCGIHPKMKLLVHVE
jgi:plastocyanin